jgi:NAD(P)-dependent dehydrogenase (short-subunit alcohol dehydrogenase family)
MTESTPLHWTADDIPNQSGRTVLVTGANSGLGLATTRALAARGAHVIMAVRDETKGAYARDALRAETGGNLDLRRLDLADLDSVRDFAASVLADHTQLDVLVNNAGIMMSPRTLTRQGFELQFGTNHLGHFALTGLLLPALRNGRDARVVTVSSGLHRRGTIHFEDLTGERRYSPAGFYAQSKFANMLFALELDRRLRAGRVPIASIVTHPGYTDTNLQSTGPTGLLRLLLKVGNRLAAHSVEVGVRSQLYAATDPHARSGQYIGIVGRGEARGHPAVEQPIESATDPALAARLWQLSEDLTGVRYDLPAPQPAG